MYGDKDEDGFYLGQVDGRQGFVPYNMVTELVTETLNGYPESENGESQEDTLSPDKGRTIVLCTENLHPGTHETHNRLVKQNEGLP